jgi:hypothetical protein
MKAILTAVLMILSVSAFSQKLNITTHTIKDSSSVKKYTISAEYPQIDFGPEALMGMRGVAEDINSDIIRVINGIMIPFKEQSAQDSFSCPQELNFLESNYTTAYKSNSYLSFMFETYISPRCAAHPMTYRTSFNYSYSNKGLLTIDSLFAPGSDWLNYISKYCIKELKARSKKDGLENNDESVISGASAKPENFNTFTITDHTLDICFNLYQVGPYVWGFQTVSIPWKDLKKMLDPEGPLGFMTK